MGCCRGRLSFLRISLGQGAVSLTESTCEQRERNKRSRSLSFESPKIPLRSSVHCTPEPQESRAFERLSSEGSKRCRRCSCMIETYAVVGEYGKKRV